MVVKLANINWKFGDTTSTIIVSEKEIGFSLSYDVISHKTGATKRFEFEHSTGGEFEPDTQWVYKSSDGLKFVVCSDADIRRVAGEAYLQSKMRN